MKDPNHPKHTKRHSTAGKKEGQKVREQRQQIHNPREGYGVSKCCDDPPSLGVQIVCRPKAQDIFHQEKYNGGELNLFKYGSRCTQLIEREQKGNRNIDQYHGDYDDVEGFAQQILPIANLDNLKYSPAERQVTLLSLCHRGSPYNIVMLTL